MNSSIPLAFLPAAVASAALLPTVAVLATQMTGFLVLRSWLLDRVDQQLDGFALPP